MATKELQKGEKTPWYALLDDNMENFIDLKNSKETVKTVAMAKQKTINLLPIFNENDKRLRYSKNEKIHSNRQKVFELAQPLPIHVDKADSEKLYLK